MAIYIQHGHGKSNRIETALNDGSAEGVIFGARNETPENLRGYIGELRGAYPQCSLLFDPQFYVATLTPPNDRYLPQYPYYSAGRTASDFASLRKIRDYVKRTLDFQQTVGLDALISPTVFFESFTDRWCQIALNLADASLDYYGQLTNAPPLLLSLVLHEASLAGESEARQFLDTITQDGWNMAGFYLIVARTENSYNQRFDNQRLACLLYIIYVLARINGLRVVCGYSDFVGILLRVVGAEVTASGWSQSLRQFHTSAFIQRRPGGQPPRERYSSSALFNSILLGELQSIDESGQLEDVLSGVPLDAQIQRAASPLTAGWTTPISQQHHWQTLASMDRRISGRLREDLRAVEKQLRDADGLYLALQATGVQFERNSRRDHLMEWVRAIEEFQRATGTSPP